MAPIHGLGCAHRSAPNMLLLSRVNKEQPALQPLATRGPFRLMGAAVALTAQDPMR